ncbi:MAG: hypothetical protein E7463_15730 [Ruminococcaceae bacterium]|nr:hypothetical protein [Oscillospiraceae bacterium]
MNIVTTTSVFPNGYPAEKALKRLAAVGFRALDLAFDYSVRPASFDPSPYLHSEPVFPFDSIEWERWASGLREQAESLGVRYTHGHAHKGAECHDELMERCFKAASVLGIGYLVVHPIWHDAENRIYEDEEAFIRVNLEAMKPLLEMAEQSGVVMLSENVLWGASARPESISRLVREVNSPWFGWCYDTGHANFFKMPQTVIRGLVPPRSLHVQDNHGIGRDEHLLPGDGNIEWKVFLDSLIDVGYAGDMVIEAHHQSIEAPDYEREGILADLLTRGQKLADYLACRR